ncbi:tail tape measure protein [Tsuneonella sp. SYSU-LHT278]|uniref:tail tape measure protein n=1 Tax=Tsuneonella sediminis TaxID=3416089 RepID=UPI003F79A4A6
MDTVDELLVEVRASTQGFASDIAAMRASFDGTLVDGFERAGQVLERGLLSALRRGSLGFDDLKRIALSTLDQIAAQALHLGFDKLFGGGTAPSGGLGGGIGGILGSLLGIPGRATGGPVSPGRPYLVGERGPEMFVPTSAGRVEPGAAFRPRDVRVAISLNAPRGSAAPQSLERSSRQVASAIRRTLMEF